MEHDSDLSGLCLCRKQRQEVRAYRTATSKRTLAAGVEGINNFMQDAEGRLWVCADNGYGYFDKQSNFVRINDSQIDTYISDMIQDYEGIIGLHLLVLDCCF